MADTLKSLARLASLALALAAAQAAHAQARAGDDAAVPSPLAPLFTKLDEALAQKVVGADDAPGRWLSGRLSGFDLAAQARDFSAAAARDTKEPLYAASLADVCIRPAAPTPPECLARDAVGYWASREADNAVPWLLQAERSRRRNATPAMIDNLERAATSARFDDHGGRGPAVAWTRVAPLVGAADRAGGALYALSYAGGIGSALAAVENICSTPSRALDPRIPGACARLGTLMAESGASFNDRRAGVQIALAAVPNEVARGLVNDSARGIVAAQERCRDARNALERDAMGAPAARAAAAVSAERFVATLAARGEVAACAELAGK
jgi:hypothetical protein